MDLEGWEYATSSRGEAYVLREAKKLKMSYDALAKLEQGMKRLADGKSRQGEVSLVRNEIWELRVNADNRWYRLLFARLAPNRVALLLVAKKRNTLDPAWTKSAQSRLRELKSQLDG